MSLEGIVLAISVATCVLNIGMIVYYSVLTRRLRRLNYLLARLCVRAFLGQHLPYWKPWAQVFGYNLALRVIPVNAPDEPDDDEDQAHEGQDRR